MTSTRLVTVTTGSDARAEVFREAITTVSYVSVVEIAELAALPESRFAHGRVAGAVGGKVLTARSVGDRVQMPRVLYALERVDATVREGDSRPEHKVLEGLGHDDLVRPRERNDSGADVDAEAGHVVLALLHLADVKADADLHADILHGLADRTRATHSTSWAVEDREESIAGSIDLLPVEARKRPSHLGVVRVQTIAPGKVAQARGVAGGVDDVSKHHGRQRPVDIDVTSRTGEELLDLIEQGLAVAYIGERVAALELDKPPAGDLVSDPAGRGRRDGQHVLPLDDERGDLHKGEGGAHVELEH
jgi:hypothetical protein